MGTRIYGIAACQSPDNAGETILIDGMDTSKLRFLNDEHSEEAFAMIGAIDFHKKIHSAQECTDAHEVRCWEVAKAPFLFIRGEIANDTDHPNAKAAAALLEFCSSRPDIQLRPGLSIEGGITKRSGPDNKTLEKTIGLGASWTVKPCHPRCALFMENDLRKSDRSMTPPPEYFEALKKSESVSSFRENKLMVLEACLEMLQKSTADYFGGFTHLKCHHCGNSIRFFKSSSNVPNRCSQCNGAFSLNQIWGAINR